jgi:hypothetical protein
VPGASAVDVVVYLMKPPGSSRPRDLRASH